MNNNCFKKSEKLNLKWWLFKFIKLVRVEGEIETQNIFLLFYLSIFGEFEHKKGPRSHDSWAADEFYFLYMVLKINFLEFMYKKISFFSTDWSLFVYFIDTKRGNFNLKTIEKRKILMRMKIKTGSCSSGRNTLLL